MRPYQRLLDLKNKEIEKNKFIETIRELKYWNCSFRDKSEHCFCNTCLRLNILLEEYMKLKENNKTKEAKDDE